jgi:biotin carboxyl carrier protein
MSEYVVRIGGREYRATVKELTPEQATMEVDGQEYRIELLQLGRRSLPRGGGRTVAVPSAAPAPVTPRAVGGPADDIVAAPMPGLVLAVKVKEGERIQAGQVLLVMEAMKMENAIAAPFTGTVLRVLVREGDSIGEGDRLVELARPKLTAL